MFRKLYSKSLATRIVAASLCTMLTGQLHGKRGPILRPSQQLWLVQASAAGFRCPVRLRPARSLAAGAAVGAGRHCVAPADCEALRRAGLPLGELRKEGGLVGRMRTSLPAQTNQAEWPLSVPSFPPNPTPQKSANGQAQSEDKKAGGRSRVPRKRLQALLLPAAALGLPILVRLVPGRRIHASVVGRDARRRGIV